MAVLRLVEIQRARECFAITCAVDDLRFHATVWYEDLDLHALARTYGEDLVDRLALHVALFQLNTLCSLRPDTIELGRWGRFATPRLVALWQTVFSRVWAQWRWEHDLPAYTGPRFVDATGISAGPARIGERTQDHAALAFCVALELLERAGVPFATLGYAHSVYGDADHQHALIDRVGAASARVRAERQWVIDDIMTAPVARLRPELGVRSILAAETPASVFAAMPLVLDRGYHELVVAHERGANTANLIWQATGEAVNHQWGKSWEAEQLLATYIRDELFSDVDYFSVLQPVHDEVIFELLARDAELAVVTHSCNVRKPWCGECAKCAYVWLQMAAHLPREVVEATFATVGDLGERPANERWWRELLGLAEHTPFECVGGVAEARLALELAHRRGMIGPRLARIAAEVGPVDVAAVARGLVGVGTEHGMPEWIADRVMPLLHEAAARAARRLGLP
jgi:hypothetical protein